MTRKSIHRLSSVLSLALLAGCAIATRPDEAPATQNGGTPGFEAGWATFSPAAAMRACRTRPDGGPPRRTIADRGIGGTGAPGGAQLSDRGIGGTGITGVITGFASICVDGLEVRYDDRQKVTVDGVAASISALRAGQLVTIWADGSPEAVRAHSIAIRSEVSGRIEAAQPGNGMMTIGGQSVSVSPRTWGGERFTIGDWVTVSGLRRNDGVIVASRLEVAEPGRLAARGRLVRDGSVMRLGRLVLPAELVGQARPGDDVRVTGSYAGDDASITAVTVDTECPDPVRCFGSDVRHVVLQAFVRTGKGVVWLNGAPVPALPGAIRKPVTNSIAVVVLERKPNGALGVASVRGVELQPLPPTAARSERSGRVAALTQVKAQAVPSPAAPPADVPATGEAAEKPLILPPDPPEAEAFVPSDLNIFGDLQAAVPAPPPAMAPEVSPTGPAVSSGTPDRKSDATAQDGAVKPAADPGGIPMSLAPSAGPRTRVATVHVPRHSHTPAAVRPGVTITTVVQSVTTTNAPGTGAAGKGAPGAGRAHGPATDKAK